MTKNRNETEETPPPKESLPAQPTMSPPPMPPMGSVGVGAFTGTVTGAPLEPSSPGYPAGTLEKPEEHEA